MARVAAATATHTTTPAEYSAGVVVSADLGLPSGALRSISGRLGTWLEERAGRRPVRRLAGRDLHRRARSAASGDQQAERVAWRKEVSYVSALEAFAWVVGDIEASFDQGKACSFSRAAPSSTALRSERSATQAEKKPTPQEPSP
jgi:hypothetical protein